MIWLYSPISTPRLQYTCRLLCDIMAGTACHIETDEDAFRAKEAVFKICYSDQPCEGSYHIKPSGLLSEVGIDAHWQQQFDEMAPAFSDATFTGNHATFDILAAVFYLVSRYEEYLPFAPDNHGRFPAAVSLLYKHKLLEQPIVNQWATALCKATGNAQSGSYAILPTIDVDVAFRYKARSIGRHIGATVKDIASLRLSSVAERLQVLSAAKPDPNDTFDYQFNCFKTHNCDARYFIQVGPYGTYDRNLSGDNTAFRQLIRHIEDHYEVGTHPSYVSNQSYKQLLAEIGTMAEIIGRKVVSSRQHFLKMRLPETYENLITCGIESEYSMGYSDTPGFRAGTATPFHWYNLKTETTTALQVVPFCLMDVTMQHFLSLDAEQSIALSEHLKQAVKKSGGIFSFVFHNEALSETRQWQGWRRVFEHMLHA